MSCAGSVRDWKTRPLAEGPNEQLELMKKEGMEQFGESGNGNGTRKNRNIVNQNKRRIGNL